MGLIGSATQRGIVFVLAGGDDPHSPTILSRNIIMLKTQKERPLIDDWMRLTPPERCALQTVGAKAPLLAFCFHQFHFKYQLTLLFFFFAFWNFQLTVRKHQDGGYYSSSFVIQGNYSATTFFFLKRKKKSTALRLFPMQFTIYIVHYYYYYHTFSCFK